MRALAVERDVNAITAAYAGIPIVEDALRNYAKLVLNFTDTGRAFDSVTSEEIGRWWKQPGVSFNLPDKNQRLSGTELAVLVAVVSEKTGHPVFERSDQLSRLLTLIDTGRNRMSHTVTTPPSTLAKELTEESQRLLNHFASHGGSELNMSELRRWVKAPKRFLEDS